jgi:hypothetical protein
MVATEKVNFGEFEPSAPIDAAELQARPSDLTAATAHRLARRGIAEAETLAVVLAYPDFPRVLPYVRTDMLQQIENTEFQLAQEELDATSAQRRISCLLTNALRLLLSTREIRQ